MPFDASFDMTDEGTDRLLRLAEVCRAMVNDADYTFDPSAWLYWDEGVHGCAVGYALHKGIFASEGLQVTEDDTGSAPGYAGMAGFRAIQRFFAISEQDALDLFYADALGSTPIEMAHRIEQYAWQRVPV